VEWLRAEIDRRKACGEPTAIFEREFENEEAIATGDVARLEAEEERSRRPFFARVIPPPRRPLVTPRSRSTSSYRPRERRERRSYSRGGDSGDDDPPGPRHVSYALAGVVDDLLAGLRAHGSDTYRLVPGQGDEPDRWAAICPMHPAAGRTLLITDRGDGREPEVWCRVGCPAGIVRYALLNDPEREREAERRAAVLLWAQSFKNGRTA
jgi:hypothetical protein